MFWYKSTQSYNMWRYEHVLSSQPATTWPRLPFPPTNSHYALHFYLWAPSQPAITRENLSPHTHTPHTHTHKSKFTHTHWRTHTHTHTHADTHTQTQRHTYTHRHRDTDTHIHTHRQTRTYTNTHTDQCILTFNNEVYHQKIGAVALRKMHFIV